jgi:glycerol-3-phosphate dehydrogenase (NAD(P)+)
MNPNSKNLYKRPVGVIGSGYFGTAIANLLAYNTDVIMYVYNDNTLELIKSTRISAEQQLSNNISITNSMQYIAEHSELLFCIVPSEFFKSYIKKVAPFLKQDHIIVHGTKGLEVNWPESGELSRKEIRTMSEIISSMTDIKNIGCISGPNLAKELAQKEPAGIVVASICQNVINKVREVLQSPNFLVFHTKDVLGTELCGVLKNAIAIAVGFITGLGYGCNTKGLVISQGLIEMIRIGRVLGADLNAFIGLAGIGDLVATCMSTNSRNHSLGYKLSTGYKLDYILNDKSQVIEGLNTVKVIHSLAKTYNIKTPITESMYGMIEKGISIEITKKRLLQNMMTAEDVDF